MKNKDNLLWINPENYTGTIIRPCQILSWFESENAYWRYEGEPSPEKAHAELSSGLCSNGFFDCLRVLSYPNIAEILGNQLGRRLGHDFFKETDFEKIEWVVSSAYAAITFGYEVAKCLNARFMNTEKDPTDPKGKGMIWRRMTIPEGANVLQVDELITTSGTFKEVRRSVEEGNAEPVNFITDVGVLIHRPSKLPMAYEDREVIDLLEK